MLRNTIRNNIAFLAPYLVILLCLIPFLVLYSKSDIHLWINQYHNKFTDIVYAYLTLLGDGIFIIIPAVILLFFSLRHVIFILTAYLSSGLVTQMLKRVFFEDISRPSKLLNFKELHLVDGVAMLNGRSFPSGHATSAFALFLCLAMISENRYVKFLCFIMACLVAFSRVYLSQHFLIDIMVGSVIGTTAALAAYLVFYKDERKWHNWTIQSAFKHDTKN